jgi:adenosylmethionine-8-amino-7-oxononanoate aminotransferase
MNIQTPTAILHRTPLPPPVAARAEGIYIDLEDGRRVIDAVGGAAVACIGNNHPKVLQAIKDQVDKMSCMCCDVFNFWLHIYDFVDVYNMQLSNQPAEELAKKLVAGSNGAFELCGFVSGGLY